ncbi:MAG: hypothetical protein ACK53L_01285, partial [Pirellulaceae bacterium]
LVLSHRIEEFTKERKHPWGCWLAASLRAKPDNVSSLVDEPQRITLVSSRYVQEERNKQTEKGNERQEKKNRVR